MSPTPGCPLLTRGSLKRPQGQGRHCLHGNVCLHLAALSPSPELEHHVFIRTVNPVSAAPSPRQSLCRCFLEKQIECRELPNHLLFWGFGNC